METRRVSRVLTADVLTRNNNLEKSWRPEGTVKLYVLCLYHFQRKPIKEFFSSTWTPKICFTSFWLSHEPSFSSCVHAYLCILFNGVIINTADGRVLTAADTIASTDLMLIWRADGKCEVIWLDEDDLFSIYVLWIQTSLLSFLFVRSVVNSYHIQSGIVSAWD